MANERISRRSFLKVAGGTVGTLILAACAPAAPSEAPKPAEEKAPAAAPAEAIVIDWWHGWGGQVALETLQKVADAFNEQNTGFQVKRTQVASVSDKLLTAIAGGTPPDVETGNIAYSEFYSRGAMQPLEDYLNASSIDREDIFDSSWDYASWQGVIYGIPSVESFLRYALSFNVDLVKAKGLDPESPPQTFDEAYEWHKILTELDQAGNVAILGFDPMDAMGGSWGGGDPFYWGAAYNKKAFDEDTGTYHVNEDWFIEVLATIQKFYDLVGAEKIDGYRNSYGTWTESPTSSFPAGVEAMIINGYWQPGELAHAAPDKTFGYAWMLVPADRKGKKVQSTGGHNSQIPKGAKHPDEAFKFIEFLLTDKAMDIIYDGTGWIGARKSYLARVDTSRYPGLDFYIRSATEADEMHGMPVDPIEGFTGNQWWDAVSAVTHHSKTPQEAAADMQEALTKEYAKRFGGS
ncbi:MAG: extracellular solute-binding protein [Chloroflexi bacterium]|nr:extracellular solute-binding protein [Chloroflexota bacterium]